MFPIIKLGSRVIQSQPLILLIAFWIGSSISKRTADRLGLNAGHVDNFIYLGFIVGLIGGRFAYVARFWSVYTNDLGAIFALNLSTFSPIGGVLIGLAAAYWYARHKKIANRKLLDALTPGLIIFAGGLALADLASGNGYGLPIHLPWSINLWGEWRHPVQVYDLLATVIIALILRRSSRPFDGAHFGLFIILYSTSRLFFEAFHGDSMTFLTLKAVQLWSLLAILTMLFVLRYWSQQESGSHAQS